MQGTLIHYRVQRVCLHTKRAQSLIATLSEMGVVQALSWAPKEGHKHQSRQFMGAPQYDSKVSAPVNSYSSHQDFTALLRSEDDCPQIGSG